MSIASVVVLLPGPPCAIVYGISKVCSAVMVRKIIATTMDGTSMGSVIWKNCCSFVAPSTSAASYSERGMVCRPASRISATNDDVFQIVVKHTAAKAQAGLSMNDTGAKPRRRSPSLTMP